MRLALLAAFVFLAAGCGGGLSVAPVSGRITIDGEPLAGANVSFQPIGRETEVVGPGSYGKTDAQGRYTLKTVDQDKLGAIVGIHWVRISIAEPAGADAGPGVMKDKLPRWYNFDTTLQFDVPTKGTDAANFELSSKKSP